MLSSMLRGLVAIAIVFAVVAGWGPSVGAQSDARRGAESALRDAIKAQGRRDHRTALTLLSKAINSSALGRSELAIALYRRAISYRSQKQPARAISDINSALFFKDALPSKDRANAIELRLRAYGDAGLTAPALATSTPRAPSSAALQAPSGPIRSAPRIINTAPRRVSGPVQRVAPRQSRSSLPPTAPILGGSSRGTQAVAVAPQPANPRISSFSTETRRGAPPASSVPAFTTRAAPAPSSVASVRSRAAVTPRGNWSTATSSRPGRVAATTSSAAAQAGAVAGTVATASRGAPPTAWRGAAAPAPQTTTGSVARVPSGPLTSGQASRPATAVREVARAGTPAASSSANDASGQGGSGFFTSLFGQSAARDSVVPQTTSSVSRPAAETPRRAAETRVAAAPVPQAPVAPRVSRAKGYDIELAALSDRFRAEAISQQVMVQYSSDFFWSSHKTRIEERAGPEGSTIYAVRLGRYRDEASARQFCGKLEAGGFDCEIVARR